MHHALSCSNGGLFIARHNGIRDEIIHLARQAFSPNCVRSEDLIRQGRSRSDGKVRHGGSIPETQGGVSIWGLWESQTEAIVYVSFRDSCADTWKSEGLDKIFPWWEKLNKDKHGQHFHDQRKKNSLFVLSVYVVLATLS